LPAQRRHGPAVGFPFPGLSLLFCRACHPNGAATVRTCCFACLNEDAGAMPRMK